MEVCLFVLNIFSLFGLAIVIIELSTIQQFEAPRKFFIQFLPFLNYMIGKGVFFVSPRTDLQPTDSNRISLPHSSYTSIHQSQCLSSLRDDDFCLFFGRIFADFCW